MLELQQHKRANYAFYTKLPTPNRKPQQRPRAASQREATSSKLPP